MYLRVGQLVGTFIPDRKVFQMWNAFVHRSTSFQCVVKKLKAVDDLHMTSDMSHIKVHIERILIWILI
jgi:hypothetical protein